MVEMERCGVYAEERGDAADDGYADGRTSVKFILDHNSVKYEILP